MANQKKRTAWSVQDVASGRAGEATGSPKFKSGYSGPKKSSSAVMERYSSSAERTTGVLPVDDIARSSKNSSEKGYSPVPRRGAGLQSGSGRFKGDGGGHSSIAAGRVVSASGAGLLDYAWILYCAVLGLCVLIAVIVYSGHGSGREGYVYPSNIFTMNGILNTIHEGYAKNGKLGSGSSVDEADESTDESVDKDSLLGDSGGSSALPNTTTGATMALDTGSTYADYSMAASHEELIAQLTKALESNDFGFVGMKLAYTDESTGDIIGYPQSVIEHFCQYMADNTGKRETFLNEIKDADTYSAKNGSAYIVKLPILKFTVNMGYDNTNVSVSGFSDQKMDAGQSAVVSPLLPCMYTITVSTDGGSQSSEVECDMSEGNLQINIGVAN